MESDHLLPWSTETNKHPCASMGQWLRQLADADTWSWPALELCIHVERCALCKGMLLVLIAAAVGIIPSVLNVECYACPQDIAAFIELEAEDILLAIRAHPLVWWHIWTCPACAADYELIGVLVKAERCGQLAAPLPPPARSARPARPATDDIPK